MDKKKKTIADIVSSDGNKTTYVIRESTEQQNTQDTQGDSVEGQDTLEAPGDLEEEETLAYNQRRMKQVQQQLATMKLGKRKKEIAIILIVLCIVVGGSLLHLLGRYDGYSVRSSAKRTDASSSTYLDFQGNLLKYSNDGVFYTDYDGNLIWNYSYEMTNPTLDQCGDYILIYDKRGTQMSVLTTTGIQGSMDTSLPIVDANVADKGTVAVLTQENDINYLQLYDIDGKTLASGELHTENSGYPIAIALSSDAKKLMVSMINLNDGDVKTNIAFYNFGSAGKKEIDNIVATYSYSSLIVPEIDFVENDKAIAFGDNEIIIYSSAEKPKVDKEIFLDTEMKSIFHNDKYFGVICTSQQEDGSTANEMTVYTMNGFRRFSKLIEIPYNKIELMDNNEIMLTNGAETNIYTLFGIKKFAYTFETSIYKIIPGDSSRRYIFIEDGLTEKVRIN